MLLIHNINNSNITPLDAQIKSFWTLNKSIILSNNKTQWNDEDLTGKSFAQWVSMSYFYLLALLTLIQLDITHTNKTWDYYYDKYDIDNLRKCLNCIGINLNKNLKAFGFPTIKNNEIIEAMSVENTFETEPETLDSISLDIATPLTTEVSQALDNNLHTKN